MHLFANHMDAVGFVPCGSEHGLCGVWNAKRVYDSSVIDAL
jgi:hypothetical protein